MPSLSLKIVQDEGAVTRKVKFDSHMTVKEAHKVVKDKVFVPNKGQEYALFLRSADDDMSGVWLENERTLDYYLLRDGDSLDYICRMRNLRVRMLDDTVKTLQVDEAKTVGELMMDICTRIGIKNYDEYGLCKEEVEEAEDGKETKEPSGGGFTLRRPKPVKERDVILEQMSKRLKTDDNVEWLDQHRTIREQGIDFKETLLLKRRLFYSDRNVDSRDPVQLHLLYVQTRDAILNGRHPVTEQQAVNFAGIQCQIQLGDYDEKKHKPGFIEKFEEYLPAQYLNAWSVEKKILKEYATHQGSSELEAKFLYIKTARAMPTYGVTFFLVKEKQKDKKKLVPRLLGINAEAILRLDEVTKEILQQWPLTHVKTYHAGKSQTFTLNFGDYSDKEYSVKTQDCLRIRDILEGYIDIIRRRMLAKPCMDPGESMAITHDNVQMGKSHLIEHVTNNPSKLVTETFVGPTKLVPYDQGSQAHAGAMITTVQQIVVTDHLQNQQQALKGEMPLRGDMSKDCIKKLNRMNSNSVKIVGLLTDPTETHVKDSQHIVRTMQEDFPVVQKGVKETADKQDIEDAKKMLLDELEDLNNYMNKLAGSVEPGKVNPNDAKDAAESIADLTTQMYFSIDPKTRRRSELLRRSRKSFRDGEKTEQTIRRASFVAAATTALHSVDTATQALHEEYTGPKLDEEQKRKLEKALEDRLGKLNAAIALYLMAHSDPDNIDYSAAINSMNAINELMPKLARDAQMLASTKDPEARKELQDEMKTLFDATKKVCGMTGNQNHEKMQEASNEYADISGQLLYKFSRGTNADKENEIVQLAKDVGAKVSRLLVTTNELTCQASSLPAASQVDDAGVRTAGAARDLLHSAQLTAPAIHEPHCQSALTAAASNLASAVHGLEATWRPVVEDPTRQHMAELLHTRANDVMKALERLKDAYGNLEDRKDADNGLPLQEKKRLKFITTLSGAKSKLLGVKFDEWNKPTTGADAPSEEEKAAAQRRLEQRIAQLNAAVAALAAATADRENPDFETAELAISTITELMPQIAKDTEIVSYDKDEATRRAMQKNLCALCDAARDMCEGDGYRHAQGEPLANFADASGKLVFLVSPSADKGKQKHIMDLSSTAHQQASELVSQAQRVQEHVEPAAAAELGNCANQTHDDAQALRAVAQVTAASIGEDRCRDALSSAVSKLQGSADKLTSSCQSQQSPQLQQSCAAVQDSHRQLSDSLGKLADVCEMGQDDSVGDAAAQQEKQRLKFVQSMSGAKRRLDAAAQQLTKPMACQIMREEDAAVLEQQLADRLAQLNAAVAALAAAAADRQDPDYAAAEQAVHTITSLMPHVVRDSRKLCGTKNDAEQTAMLQNIIALCDASKEMCDSVGQPQGLNDAATKYIAASRNLMFHVSPGADNEKENEVIGLSADACGKASELLSQVQRVTELLPDAGAAAELDARGARAADAAQALLTVAQATAPTIANANCQRELISAAEKLRSTASELTSSCAPHLAQGPEMTQQMLSSQRQLADSLDKLVEVCKSAEGGTQSAISPAEKEKRRLKFINSLTGAKNRLYDSEQQLNQPMTKQAMNPEEAAALEHRLADRLAQLNAAVAALAAARADPENPDYAAAEKAVKEISELMPLIVQDSRKLSSTKDAAGQAAMLDELTALCQASRRICENTENSPKVDTTEFNKAARKLVFLVSPAADETKEKQVKELSEAACKLASRHASLVESVAERPAPAAPAQLAPAAARLRAAADTLHAVTHATSPTISEPTCSAAVISAAENLRSTASDLTASCGPHVQQRPEMKQQVLSSQRQLADSLDKLMHACQPGLSGNLVDVPSAQQQDKQRLKFISSVSGAKDRLDAAEKQLKEPLICQLMKQEDGAAMERKLSDRLAQLNAAVAALAAATADREHPDYAAADRAVRTITELMPQVVQESHTLCGSKSGEEQAAMLRDLRALCEASRDICERAGQAQALSDAAAKFSAASGKLVYIVSPAAQDVREKQVLALSAASCGKAGELLSQVQRITEVIPDAGAAAELDSRGARAADAAQALLTVAQATAPTIGDPHCQKQLISAAEKLRSTASELTSSCAPHLAQRPEMKQQVLSSQRQLADSLDKLVEACNSVEGGNWVDVPSAQQQEKQRLKFISSVSAAKDRLDAAEQQLKKPMICQMMKQEDGVAMERKLSDRLAQLNAAVAALAAATADREHPDYAAADRAVRTITELMPQVVQESHTLCGSKSGEEQAAMLRDLRALCEASRDICERAGQAQALSDAAAKFSAASGKLVYIVSPAAQDVREKQVLALSAASCGKAGELLSQVQRITEVIPDAGAAAELDSRGARAADAAQALLTVAQATAPTIRDPHCQKQLISAAEKLRSTASELTSLCAPHLAQRPEMKQQVLSSQGQLADCLDKLVQACKTAQHDNLEDTPSAQQEKHRLKFISSLSGAKNDFDSAEHQLSLPILSQEKQDPAALQRKLSDRLAQLNAAVAALAAAAADRENPDYAAAHQAVETIPKLLREVIHDSRALTAIKAGPGAVTVSEDLKALCEASREICENVGQPQALSDAAAKFSAASGKLVYIVSPAAQDVREKQVLALSAASCGKAGELLSQVQRITEVIPDAGAAAELDSRGARAADAAQALLTVAQATAPTIGDPHCQKQLISAAEKLRSTASELTSLCAPHLAQRPEMKQQVLSSQGQLADCLDKLVQACKTAQHDNLEDTPSAQQEKHRLKFISSLSGAKNDFDSAEHQLSLPILSQEKQDPAALQRKLSDRLAQLNAAVAALAAAAADRENPDYAAAHQAVETIPKLLREVIHDSRALTAIKAGPGAVTVSEDLKALCEASREICENVGQPQALSDAAAKFSAASGKLVYIVSPAAQDVREKQVLALSAASCGKAGELLSQVQRITEVIPDAGAAAELDSRGARAADAAQALLTVAQATAPTIGDPHCQKQLISAAEKLRSTASELTSLCAPHLAQRPEMKQQVLSSQGQLADCLDKLVQACKTAQHDNLEDTPSAQQEKHRLKFISSLSGAKNDFDSAEHQLSLPILSQEKQDPAALQRKLSDRLAQLNAAVAALAAAAADRENPDYAAAHQAVETIPKLLREVIHDSRALTAIKAGPGAVTVSEDLKALCEASREICENVGQPQALSDAAAKFSAASGKLVYIVSPAAQDVREKQVLALSAASCGKAGELLSQVQRITEVIPDAGAAAELDSRGARAADAAQALLTVAQATAPTIGDPHCQKQLISAAEKLRSTASELTSLCAPHLAQRPEMKQQVLSSQGQLADCLDKLVQACKTAQHDNLEDTPSAQQEKHRLKFISSLSGAKNDFDSAEHQLSLPILSQEKQDPAALQRKLSDRLAQLNAAVAALAAAAADRENPDYAAAHQAVETIPKLLREVIHDSRSLTAIKAGPGAVAVSEDLKALCEASREICENVGQPQGLGEAAAKFSAASGKMMALAGPKTYTAQEKLVIDLSAASCGKASELLSQVQRVTELVPDAGAAAELDARGARAADAAQALLNVAQITASSVSEPGCATQFISTAEKLRSKASELTSSCAPHLAQRPEMKQQVLSSQGQLADSLDKLVQACKTAQHGTDVVLTPQQEKQRIEFVSSVSGARKHLDTAEQQMKKPVVSQKLTQADGATLQHKLSRALAQLNAAVAALAAATQDSPKNPDYPAAERAVTTITELIPQVVQASHSLCSSRDAGQAAALQQLQALCAASRAICDSAGHPKKLNEASIKLATASGKLVSIVSPEGSQVSKPAVPVRKAPPPTPARDPKHTVAQAVRSSVHADSTQAFLDTLRGEESRDKVKIVSVDAKKALAASEEEKRAYKQFCEMIDSAEKGLKTAEDGLKVLHNAKTTTAGNPLPAVEVARREQHMEDSLARAGVHLAALVAANYADKLDYKAAMEPTISLTESVKSVVNDGSAIYSSLPEHTRKPFVDNMTGLCQATKSICDAAKSKEEVKKLNDAAISFGDQSVKLLRVVSCKVDPALEKEVISRAKAIGDTASRLALEASHVASSALPLGDAQPACVEHICTAGASCVDAAGKLVYTAKLIAPTIHHATCQDTLVSSADNLSASLTKFSKTWAPLSSSQQPCVHKLTQEAGHLEDLVERLRKDVKAGKLGKTKAVEQVVNLDSPLRKMTVQIIETAKSMAEYGEMTADQRKEYINYSNRLEEAIRALDLANARYQRAPHDKNKREELEIATQDLQMTLLQTRPSRAGQEQNNIVDFRDFLQDLVKEAGELQSCANKNEGPAGKRTTDDIKMLSSKISEDASRLLNPPDNYGDGVTVMNSVDDIMDIDVFGQECDVMVKEINGAIQGVHDQKAKQALRAQALPLNESCHLLRFAVHSHIMATKSAAFDEALQNLDHFQNTVMLPLAKEAARKSQKEKKSQPPAAGAPGAWQRARACGLRAHACGLRARARAVLGDPEPLSRAVTYYAVAAAATPRRRHRELQTATPMEKTDAVEESEVKPTYIGNLQNMVRTTQDFTNICCSLQHPRDLDSFDTQAQTLLKELNDSDHMISSRKICTPVLNAEDIDKLLLCKKQPVEGTPKQLEDKVHQLSTKLSSMSGTVVLSVKRPESLARSLHAAADTAAQLAGAARALQDRKRPVQCKKIEEASQEMCLATYSLLKTSELVCQDPNHHDARRKLLEACRLLNDSINKLVRSVNPEGRVNQECGEVHRSLQLQRSLLQASPQPCGALPYVHCVDTLQSQRDVLQKLNSDQAMSREEFLKSLNYVASAVSNSTECAAQAAYLISVSEKDVSIGKEGIVDVAKLHKAVGAVEETCVSIVMANQEEQVQEEAAVLKVQVQDLLHDIDDGIKKTKDGELKDMLKQCRNEINSSSGALFKGVAGNPNDKEKIISKVMDLMDDINDASDLIEHPDLVPTAGEVSAETQKHVDEVMKSSLALLTNTEELIKQVKSAPDEPEVMKWVMFNKRKDVFDAFENLLKNVKTSGQRVKLIEGSTDDSEEEKKSYVQKQFDSASKWLLKSVSKAEVKTNGQQAVRNLIEVANKVTEDLKGSEKEDMSNLVKETEQLLTECSKKYDHEQYSVLMERVRELKKGIERGVVTRVVQDFMDAEAPLADLDLVADYEQDESKRKFLLEKKIAELLAQLSRVTKTARLIADTDRDTGTTVSTQLNSCSEQAELLAPMLVKAAQQRVAYPDDKAVIEHYKTLLTRYAESLSKIRDLCDQSVDPMDFVQTAGETMERMREESTKHNDPMKCAHTSAAITKLANRVIHVGMSSSTARSDPELQKALTEAQQQLTAATPAADTRASRMPDWKDTTAKILQATEEVESLLCGETIFKNQPGPNQPIYNEALNLHVAIRDWSSRDNEIVAVAKRMAVLMAKLSNFMNNDKQREVLATSKSIVTESHEVARLAKKLAHECTDHRIKTNLLQTCERIPTISGQLKMLTTVKGFSLGRHGTQEDKEALDMLVGNAQSLMLSIQDVVKGAASASVKIMSQRGPRMKWVRKTVY